MTDLIDLSKRIIQDLNLQKSKQTSKINQQQIASMMDEHVQSLIGAIYKLKSQVLIDIDEHVFEETRRAIDSNQRITDFEKEITSFIHQLSHEKNNLNISPQNQSMMIENEGKRLKKLIDSIYTNHESIRNYEIRNKQTIQDHFQTFVKSLSIIEESLSHNHAPIEHQASYYKDKIDAIIHMMKVGEDSQPNESTQKKIDKQQMMSKLHKSQSNQQLDNQINLNILKKAYLKQSKPISQQIMSKLSQELGSSQSSKDTKSNSQQIELQKQAIQEVKKQQYQNKKDKKPFRSEFQIRDEHISYQKHLPESAKSGNQVLTSHAQKNIKNLLLKNKKHQNSLILNQNQIPDSYSNPRPAKPVQPNDKLFSLLSSFVPTQKPKEPKPGKLSDYIGMLSQPKISSQLDKKMLSNLLNKKK